MSNYNTPLSTRIPLLSVLSQAMRMEGFEQYIAEQLAQNSNSNFSNFINTPNMNNNMSRPVQNELFCEPENEIALLKDRIDLLERTVNDFKKMTSDLRNKITDMDTQLNGAWEFCYEIENDLHQSMQYSRR